MNNPKVNIYFYELKKYSFPLTLKKFNFSFSNKFVLWDLFRFHSFPFKSIQRRFLLFSLIYSVDTEDSTDLSRRQYTIDVVMEEADDRVNEVIDRQIRGLTKACSCRRHTGSFAVAVLCTFLPPYTHSCVEVRSPFSHSPSINARYDRFCLSMKTLLSHRIKNLHGLPSKHGRL